MIKTCIFEEGEVVPVLKFRNFLKKPCTFCEVLSFSAKIV